MKLRNQEIIVDLLRKKIKMRIDELYKKKNFLITAEITPPKGPDPTKVLEKAKLLNGYVDAINITDNQRSMVRLGSLALSYLIKEKLNIPTIYQLTCRDRNRIALQSDLLSAAMLGINNVLCLTGDNPIVGDHPEAKPVFDLDGIQLIQVVKKLNSGFDMNEHKLNKNTDFCIGAAINPSMIPIDNQVIPFVKKVKAGVYFFQTQAIFEPIKLNNFLNEIKIYLPEKKYKIIAGVLLIKSKKMLDIILKIPGVYVPENIIKRFENSTNELETGINICVDIINELKLYADGIHIMAINSEDAIPKIIEKLTL